MFSHQSKRQSRQVKSHSDAFATHAAASHAATAPASIAHKESPASSTVAALQRLADNARSTSNPHAPATAPPDSPESLVIQAKRAQPAGASTRALLPAGKNHAAQTLKHPDMIGFVYEQGNLPAQIDYYNLFDPIYQASMASGTNMVGRMTFAAADQSATQLTTNYRNNKQPGYNQAYADYGVHDQVDWGDGGSIIGTTVFPARDGKPDEARFRNVFNIREGRIQATHNQTGSYQGEINDSEVRMRQYQRALALYNAAAAAPRDQMSAKELRTVERFGIDNADTIGVMWMCGNEPDHTLTLYPGTNEFCAMLGTPNVKGVLWMLMDHVDALNVAVERITLHNLNLATLHLGPRDDLISLAMMYGWGGSTLSKEQAKVPLITPHREAPSYIA